MKNSIIEDIYYGRCGNAESVKLNEEYKNASREASELYDKLNNVLNEDGKTDLEKIWYLSSVMEGERSKELFKEGLKIGLLLSAECFGN